MPIVFGIKLIAEGGNFVWATSVIALGLVLAVVFVRRQMDLPDPLLDLRLFRRPAVTAALGINILDFFVGFGILVLVAQYLQLVLGLTPLEAGLWSIPAGVGFVVGSLLTSTVLRLMRPAYVLGLGLAFAAGGLALMAYAAEMHSLILIVLGNALFSVGSAPGIAIVADLVVSAAPKERSGAASALSETASEFGGALGIALLGSLATLLYRSALGLAMPTGVPVNTMETALRGIGAASSLTPGLGNGGALLSAARGAYTSAADVTFLTAAGIMLVAAIVAVTMFRGSKTQE
ncbi:MFS transporter [Mesorhizobium sp. AR02]|uniref:MFS transporter n=1 Tax=Mesorhizobium sp. AR02 TaxID=2865837 RepID=UPI00215F2A96|nr:MFS transporter [Mesorhizobium sp. AR02]UVK52534.1 MFS transporter [Mesorhizobium sp. AR02]